MGTNNKIPKAPYIYTKTQITERERGKGSVGGEYSTLLLANFHSSFHSCGLTSGISPYLICSIVRLPFILGLTSEELQKKLSAPRMYYGNEIGKDKTTGGRLGRACADEDVILEAPSYPIIFHSRPQSLRFLNRTKALGNSKQAQPKSSYASTTAHAQCKIKMAAYLDAAIVSALKKQGKTKTFA